MGVRTHSSSSRLDDLVHYRAAFLLRVVAATLEFVQLLTYSNIPLLRYTV